jgi:hypothetical protein
MPTYSCSQYEKREREEKGEKNEEKIKSDKDRGSNYHLDKSQHLKPYH